MALKGETVKSKKPAIKAATKPNSPSTGLINGSDNKQAGDKKRKRANTAAKPKIDPNDLLHGLGVKAPLRNETATNGNSENEDNAGPTKKRRTTNFKKTPETNQGLTATAASKAEAAEKPRKKKKPSQYGVQLGVTPYPELQRPTHEECFIVNQLLSDLHGQVEAPENIPVPSRTVAGCGEVKFVLEALIRTHLSAHTSMKNANLAIQGLLERYKTFETGASAGSVDWNSVRLDSREELEKAIKSGGMAPTKSKAIKATLDMVYEENQTKREELRGEKIQDKGANGIGKDANLPEGATKSDIMARLADQILREDNDILTLDYLHAMSPMEAFNKLLTFPGVGVKTAACTLLFCMQRACFAVDTHVFRLCKWLGWVPEHANRDTTFAHCDVRVPDELKYSLHQLLICHGKSCGKCRAITGENSEAWNEECVLENLLKRTGKRKGGDEAVKPARKGKAAGKSKKALNSNEGEEEEEGEEERGPDNDGIAIQSIGNTETKKRNRVARVKKTAKEKSAKGNAVKNASPTVNVSRRKERAKKNAE